jgi:uncharacterized pyridoxal phosphate-dependent enzyme
MDCDRELGVGTLINADGMKTRLGGSLMPPEVVAAMAQAARAYVELPMLLQAAGRRVAQLIGSPAIEDAAIVSGAAAGLAVSTAACVAGTDPAKIRALPHLDWPEAKDQVVIQKTHVTGYAQGYRDAGPRLVVIGGPEGVTPAEFAAAISERTAAVTFCAGELPGHARFPTHTSLAEVVEIAQARGVPVIVDAAELPPPEHLRLFNELGADLVVFSGGKGRRGPQSSGLILGKAALIEACRLNASPHASIGRPMKAGKEEVCGLVKAVELYVARDHAADRRFWDACAQAVLDLGVAASTPPETGRLRAGGAGCRGRHGGRAGRAGAGPHHPPGQVDHRRPARRHLRPPRWRPASVTVSPAALLSSGDQVVIDYTT